MNGKGSKLDAKLVWSHFGWISFMISALFGFLFSNDPFVFPAVLGILKASPVMFAQQISGNLVWRALIC